MRQKSIARKPTRFWDLLSFSGLRLALETRDFITSSEPKSTIQGPQDLEALRSLAGIPPSVHLLLAGEIRPDACPDGFFVIYEYAFKIGF